MVKNSGKAPRIHRRPRCRKEHNLGAIEPGGPLFWLAVGAAIAVFLLVETLLVLSALRVARRPAHPGEDGPPRPKPAAEVVLTLLPAGLLLVLVLLSIRALAG